MGLGDGVIHGEGLGILNDEMTSEGMGKEHTVYLL